jgi:hypothetical protein
METAMQIHETLKVISRCWLDAEAELKKEISGPFPGIGEEFITEYFHGLFQKQLQESNINMEIQNAFFKDLKDHNIYFDSTKLKDVSAGIIAKVTLHKRSDEGKKTGGDLGILINRPDINMATCQIDYYRRGLLCQAKLFKTTKWGGLTKPQERLLKLKLDYSALLLYRYKDA